jgi:single-strand DNA-binding protein
MSASDPSSPVSGLNHVVLAGRLSSAPVERALASGSVLWSLEVTTETESGACSVPVVWFDPSSPPLLDAGSEVLVRGTVRRRFFRSGGGTQSRTEVLAEEVVDLADRRRARGFLRRVGADVAARLDTVL